MAFPPITGKTLLLLNVAIGLGTFIQVLDTSIANVAIPYIAGNLASSADEGTWVITSFAVSNAIVLPLTGWLSNYFGQVRLFVYSIVLFSIFSFLCGFSTSLAMLVFFRVIQGAVAGSLIPLSQSLLMINNPPEKQGTALGFWAMIVIVAPITGPIVGGYLTEVYSWPWIFYINVPIGIFSAFVIWNLLKDRETPLKRNPIDWVGLFLLSLGVGCLQIMLDKGKDLDWFESNAIIALTITAAISLSYFIIWTWFEKYPIVDFSVFRDRNFSLGTLMITGGYLFFFGGTVILPLWLQTEQNYTAFWAGVAVAPIGIMPVLLSMQVGKNLYRFDIRAVSSLSFILLSASFFFVVHYFTTDVSLRVVMFSRFLQGFGITIFFIPLVQISLANIPPEKYSSASGIFNFIRILFGSGFGTSLAVEFWTRREIFHHSRLSELVTVYTPATRQFYDLLNTFNLKDNVINQLVDISVEQQAFMLATNDMFWFAAWLLLLMAPLPIFFEKTKNVRQIAVEA